MEPFSVIKWRLRMLSAELDQTQHPIDYLASFTCVEVENVDAGSQVRRNGSSEFTEMDTKDAELGTKNESISVYGRKLLAGGRSTIRAQYSGGWFRFDKGSMPGRRSSTVGSRRVRFGSRARTINKRCTILAAMYVNLDLRDSSNGTHTQRRTTSSGLDETENISINKLTYWG
ncbi:hypothetical protein VNO78_23661 [Psophocarpus tetragonolobus]|uniref:Uncharacterized protein n=1 Tax=Psophocarpus tetragonolobus TaxID=3891 RepID=A0AAN9S3H3_PSOTE